MPNASEAAAAYYLLRCGGYVGGGFIGVRVRMKCVEVTE